MTALIPREEPLALPAGRAVEVELGCGDARFTLERAAAEPGALFVGLDIREEFLGVAREEVARLGLDNVLLAATNLIVDAELLFEPGRLRRIHINFPDPWFKARQKNRRWFDERTLPALERALQPGGELLYQTDVWDLALDALGLLEGSDALANTAGPWTFLRRPPFPQQTNREVACLEEGKPIWRMLFRKGYT